MVKRAGENDLGVHKISFLNKKTAVEKESMAGNGSWSLPVGRLNLKLAALLLRNQKATGHEHPWPIISGKEKLTCYLAGVLMQLDLEQQPLRSY